MDRRRFVTLLAAGTATALAGCSAAQATDPSSPATTVPPELTGPAPAPEPPALPPPPPASARVTVPPGPLTALPGPGQNLALTVDDGADPAVVEAYIQFAEDTGARFTFFVTGRYPAWTDLAPRLRPLVDTGQIQLGNHTWSHPDLTSLGADDVADELNRTRRLLRNTYGVDGTPYFRPPYGYRNPQLDRIAADLGYTVPTLWFGSLSDSGIITEEYLVKMAHRYFTPQAIVIGHANHPTVTHCYPQLVEVIRERNLSMVTLDDVLLRR
ncbi:polysaccharide deacetylase family protein [Tomitella gaofuii]|uniref:polysaccharide deacetylase family protein n=1 Tax=Tomitella gaofuii TaxID=2760083 RepID=UPI0015F7C51D|nr:polysaccharide deacetylase family protein [Tomitella gaofuii]